jgi:predicted dehydrogenase
MTQKLKVACIGAGFFSQFHLGSWARLKEVGIVGVADMDLAAAERTGHPAFKDPDTMLRETSPDIVDIITPPVAQAAMVRLALAHGVPTIICQKPFCRSLAEAEAVTAEAEAAGALLIVHENFRFMPWYRFVRTALQAGRVGDLHQVTFRLRPGDGQGPRAYLDRQPYFQQMERFLVEETAVHWIDTFRFLLGAPRSIYADLRRINPVIAGEDAGMILFEFENGVRALFDGNRHLDHASDNLRRTMGEAVFEGTAGVLSLHGDGRVTLREFGRTEEEVLLPPDQWDGFGGDCVHALQSHVVAALLDGSEVENRARDYCDVLRIRDAAYQSAETGQKVSL